MTTAAKVADLALSRNVAGRKGLLRALYWQEWFAHGSELLLAMSFWLIGQWVLMLFFHPGWVIGWGTILAVWLGAGFAGADAHEGAEEFTLALPPQRAQRYHVRLGMSLSFLVLLLGVSLLAIRHDWPQRLWGLVVETGFTEPFKNEDSRVGPWLYYGLAIACPLAAYGVSFGMACLACTKDHVALSGLLGLLYTGAGVLVGQAIESWLWQSQSSVQRQVMTGEYSFAILAVLAVLYLVVGYFGYLRKDGISRPRGTRSPEWTAGLALAGILLLLLVLVPVALALLQRAVW